MVRNCLLSVVEYARDLGVCIAVYIGGCIEGATDFSSNALFCRWRLVFNADTYSVLDGDSSGQTQLCEVSKVSILEHAIVSSMNVHLTVTNQEGEIPSVAWSQPLEMHLSCTALEDWPSLLVEVWEMDSVGRSSFGW